MKPPSLQESIDHLSAMLEETGASIARLEEMILGFSEGSLTEREAILAVMEILHVGSKSARTSLVSSLARLQAEQKAPQPTAGGAVVVNGVCQRCGAAVDEPWAHVCSGAPLGGPTLPASGVVDMTARRRQQMRAGLGARLGAGTQCEAAGSTNGVPLRCTLPAGHEGMHKPEPLAGLERIGDNGAGIVGFRVSPEDYERAKAAGVHALVGLEQLEPTDSEERAVRELLDVVRVAQAFAWIGQLVDWLAHLGLEEAFVRELLEGVPYACARLRDSFGPTGFLPARDTCRMCGGLGKAFSKALDGSSRLQCFDCGHLWTANAVLCVGCAHREHEGPCLALGCRCGASPLTPAAGRRIGGAPARRPIRRRKSSS